MAASSIATKPKRHRLVVKRGAVPPAVYLMHISDKQWEKFIESACHQRPLPRYAQVKMLGNANDKGRDVEARLQKDLVADGWDLFQAKHYSTRLAPGDAFPEMAKFFLHLSKGSYPEPRKYYFCAPQNAGPELHDLLADASKLKASFLAAWRNGTHGLGVAAVKISSAAEAIAEKFDFSKFEECLVHELLDWHSRNVASHFKLFGIEPERGDDPAVPAKAQPHEQVYVEELLRVYSERSERPILMQDVDSDSDGIYGDHFAAQREVFYAAEGLRRFSRDIYPEDEFENLLQMVKKGIQPKVTSPRLTTGFDRLDAALDAVSGLSLQDSVLHPRLRGGDLPGACHHLVNEKKLKWVR